MLSSFVKYTWTDSRWQHWSCSEKIVVTVATAALVTAISLLSLLSVRKSWLSVNYNLLSLNLTSQKHEWNSQFTPLFHNRRMSHVTFIIKSQQTTGKRAPFTQVCCQVCVLPAEVKTVEAVLLSPPLAAVWMDGGWIIYEAPGFAHFCTNLPNWRVSAQQPRLQDSEGRPFLFSTSSVRTAENNLVNKVRCKVYFLLISWTLWRWYQKYM